MNPPFTPRDRWEIIVVFALMLYLTWCSYGGWTFYCDGSSNYCVCVHTKTNFDFNRCTDVVFTITISGVTSCDCVPRFDCGAPCGANNRDMILYRPSIVDIPSTVITAHVVHATGSIAWVEYDPSGTGVFAQLRGDCTDCDTNTRATVDRVNNPGMNVNLKVAGTSILLRAGLQISPENGAELYCTNGDGFTYAGAYNSTLWVTNTLANQNQAPCRERQITGCLTNVGNCTVYGVGGVATIVRIR